MSLIDNLNQDLKAAMKSKNKPALRTIRSIKSAIMLMQTDGTGKEIDEASEIKLLQKLIKQRKDSLDVYIKQDREDLAVTEREEIEIIEKYLPQQLSEADLEKALTDIIAQVGATSMKDMGKIMGMASQKLGGSADGKSISIMVKKLLS